MSSAAAVLQRLEGFPADLSDLALSASASDADINELVSSLNKLAIANPTPEARTSISQAIALLPPSKVFEEEDLLYAQDPGRSIPKVTKHLAEALDKGVYDVKKWVYAAAKADTPRARDAIAGWAHKDHFEELLDLVQEGYSDTKLRIGFLTAIISTILSSDYTPETPFASTMMYRLAAHPVFEQIGNSLLLDTSNHLFPLALSAMVTILPFSLPLFTKHVPLLMVILGRAISWRDRPFVDAGMPVSGFTTTPPPAPRLNWTVATSEAEADMVAATTTEKRVVQLFLIGLYEAWPSNMLAFVRNQADYLKNKDVETVYAVPWEEVWKPGVLAGRLLPLIHHFQLRPSMITFTSKGELADEKRWDKYDPSEFVSMAHVMSQADDPQNMFEFFKDPELRLDPPTPMQEQDERPDMDSADMDDIRRLREENELLRLESLYSDRTRKQLIYHIGRLHRNSLRFNSDEAEIHTFANRIKEQAKTITNLTRDLTAMRSDASQAQQKHVKWQEQLRDKVSSFREERRNWQTEATQLRSDLGEAQATVRKQRDELAQAKSENFILNSQLLETMPKIQHIEDYETRNKQLTESQLLWDADVTRLREAEAASQASANRIVELEGMLQAREKICREQAEAITHLESRMTIVASRPGTPHSRAGTPLGVREMKRLDSSTGGSGGGGDVGFYQSVAENARKRCEKLEREKLELEVEVERLRRQVIAKAAGDSSALLGVST